MDAGIAFHCGRRGGGGVGDEAQPRKISVMSAAAHARRRVGPGRSAGVLAGWLGGVSPPNAQTLKIRW
jgi:hypothetical protein